MSAELGTCGNILRVILVIINALFTLLGLAAVGIGIWVLVEGNDYDYFLDGAVVIGGTILIIAGVVTIVISAVGILGAIFKLRLLLVIYAVAIVLVVVLEVLVGVLGFVFRDQVVDELEERSLEAIRLYRVSQDHEERREDVNTAIDAVQTTFDCCGYNNASDWINLNFEAVLAYGLRPPECPMCNESESDNCMNFSVMNFSFRNITHTFSFNTTADGCADDAADRFSLYLYSVASIGIAFGVLEILGIVLGLLLCCCISVSDGDDHYV